MVLPEIYRELLYIPGNVASVAPLRKMDTTHFKSIRDTGLLLIRVGQAERLANFGNEKACFGTWPSATYNNPGQNYFKEFLLKWDLDLIAIAGQVHKTQGDTESYSNSLGI